MDGLGNSLLSITCSGSHSALALCHLPHLESALRRTLFTAALFNELKLVSVRVGVSFVQSTRRHPHKAEGGCFMAICGAGRQTQDLTDETFQLLHDINH